jgi:hypothetical protein
VLLHILTAPRAEQPARKLAFADPLSGLIFAPLRVQEPEIAS